LLFCAYVLFGKPIYEHIPQQPYFYGTPKTYFIAFGTGIEKDASVAFLSCRGLSVAVFYSASLTSPTTTLAPYFLTATCSWRWKQRQVSVQLSLSISMKSMSVSILNDQSSSSDLNLIMMPFSIA
jgi:hypothetical protein